MSTMLASGAPPASNALPKSPTGISGFDELTGGGLPQGRPTLLCGGPGCGKTLMAIEFVVRGIQLYGEPGVFVSFEERPEELAQNVRSLGLDLEQLQADGKLMLDYVHVDRSEIDETGEFDLEGLFVRLGYAVETVGAKRIVLDTIESLFAGLNNHSILRTELRRLFRWIKNRHLTAIVTCERGEGALTRHGLEEYVSDCVILLDHRVSEQLSTRRLRIVKYRGSSHGADEHPFLIDEYGVSVLPVTSTTLHYPVSDERVSSGVAALDDMLGGAGFYRGSTILVSGTAGTGKTSLSAHFARATCERGEPCLYVAFEESPGQLKRNMRSIGLDLEPFENRGLLNIHAARPTLFGLETHLATINRLVREVRPTAVIVDPISNLDQAGTAIGASTTLVRLMDLLRRQGITTFMTHLTSAKEPLRESTSIGVSSLVDTWLLLRDIEEGGERNRAIYVLKSRGTAHSNQIREFLLTRNGIELIEAYIGPEGVLTGSARLAQVAREEGEMEEREYRIAQGRRDLDLKRMVLDAKIAALRAEFAAEVEASERLLTHQIAMESRLKQDRIQMARSRHVTQNTPGNGSQSDGGAA